MELFTPDKIQNLSLGAALLGSGGGGGTSYSLLIVNHQFEKYGPVRMISLSDLKDDDLVVPLGFMGAPLVHQERVPCEREIEAIIREITKAYGRMPTALSVTEIGGSNAFVPFYIAGKLGLPVVDADLIGRAFPELQMVSTQVYGIKPTSCFMSDVFGNTVIINCSDLERVEKYARQMTIAFGSSSSIVLHVLSGKEARQAMIPKSISRACEIGNAILSAQELHQSPLRAVLKLMQGRLIGSGMITDIDQKIESGFLRGSVTISDAHRGVWRVAYQNEYLFAYQDKRRLAATPDIIAILDAETGVPITSESLSFGLRVNLITVPSPEIWYTAAGLKLVGPDVFGDEEALQK